MNHDDERTSFGSHGMGAGWATTDDNGVDLDAAFAWFGWGEGGDDGLAGLRETRDELRNVTTRPIRMTIDVDEAPASVADGYLRLHLLSGRFAAPRGISLDGIFGTLTNVAWTSAGPVALHELDATRIRVRAAGQHLTVNGVDKFPRMTDYVVPSVRIADASLECGWTLTSPKAPVIMKDSVTSMPAPLERQWSKAEFPPASSLATETMLAVARRLWARCRAVAPLKSPLVSAVYSVRTRASVSASVMTALLRQACTSLRAPRCSLLMATSSRRSSYLAVRGSCLFVMVRPVRLSFVSAPGRGAH